MCMEYPDNTTLMMHIHYNAACTTRCNSKPILLTTDELTIHITGQQYQVNNSLLKVIQGRYCDLVQEVWSRVGVSDRIGSPLHPSTNNQ